MKKRKFLNKKKKEKEQKGKKHDLSCTYLYHSTEHEGMAEALRCSLEYNQIVPRCNIQALSKAMHVISTHGLFTIS